MNSFSITSLLAVAATTFLAATTHGVDSAPRPAPSSSPSKLDLSGSNFGNISRLMEPHVDNSRVIQKTKNNDGTYIYDEYIVPTRSFTFKELFGISKYSEFFNFYSPNLPNRNNKAFAYIYPSDDGFDNISEGNTMSSLINQLDELLFDNSLEGTFNQFGVFANYHQKQLQYIKDDLVNVTSEGLNTIAGCIDSGMNDQNTDSHTLINNCFIVSKEELISDELVPTLKEFAIDRLIFKYLNFYDKELLTNGSNTPEQIYRYNQLKLMINTTPRDFNRPLTIYDGDNYVFTGVLPNFNSNEYFYSHKYLKERGPHAKYNIIFRVPNVGPPNLGMSDTNGEPSSHTNNIYDVTGKGIFYVATYSANKSGPKYSRDPGSMGYVNYYVNQGNNEFVDSENGFEKLFNSSVIHNIEKSYGITVSTAAKKELYNMFAKPTKFVEYSNNIYSKIYSLVNMVSVYSCSLSYDRNSSSENYPSSGSVYEIKKNILECSASVPAYISNFGFINQPPIFGYDSVIRNQFVRALIDPTSQFDEYI